MENRVYWLRANGEQSRSRAEETGQDNWVGEVGQGFTTVTVVVQQPPVKHEVKMKDFLTWLGRQGRSPAEVMLKQRLEKILGKVNHARS